MRFCGEQLLLERGVSHRDVDKQGTTPLMIAAQWGRLDNIKLLLEWEQRKAEEKEKADAEMAAAAEDSEKEHGSDDDEVILALTFC
jgi:ankyrin repeat protein